MPVVMDRQNSSLSPKASRAEAWILCCIKDGTYLPGDTLPPIRQLVATIGVSHVTVWKAVKRLCKLGVLVSVPGQLTKVAGAETSMVVQQPPTVKLPESRRRHWSFVARQIEQDILVRRYEPGANLPSMKWLAGHYRTTYRTLSAVLNALSRDGLVKPRGIGYCVPGLSSAKPGAAIVFLADKAYIESWTLPLQTGHDHLGPLEVCASMASVRVALAPCVYQDDQLVAENPATVFPASGDTGPAILGYVYLLNHPDPSRIILESLAHTSKPVCILDESGIPWTLPAGLEQFFRVFPIATTQLPGRIMGRYLIGLGHRKIAYFSVHGAFPWSIARLQGIEQSFRSAGIHNGVARYALDSDIWWFESRSRTNAPRRASRSASGTQTGGPFQGEHAARILTALQTLYSDTKSIERHLEGMFLAALKDRSITAWVTENDEIAILAAGFLRHRGVTLPQRLSLLSFDNSARAAAGRITSYDFGIPTITHNAIRHIVEFPPKRKRNAPVCMEFDGMIIERDSSGRPRQA